MTEVTVSCQLPQFGSDAVRFVREREGYARSLDVRAVRTICDVSALAGARADGRRMTAMAMTHRDVTSILGPVDEAIAAEVLAIGATREELAQAWAWVNSDEAMIGEGRHLPDGRVAVLVDLLTPEPDEE